MAIFRGVRFWSVPLSFQITRRSPVEGILAIEAGEQGDFRLPGSTGLHVSPLSFDQEKY
jgi:hypothetical protein